jgi:hypothetical protein
LANRLELIVSFTKLLLKFVASIKMNYQLHNLIFKRFFMNKILFSLLLTIAFSISINAQTANIGTPKSWSLKNSGQRELNVHQLPAFDLAAQLRADAINEANKIGPWRFGYEHNVNFGLNNGGSWIQLPNGDRIWRIIFRSPGALSMNVLFDKFVLPEGASVYIYDEEHKSYEGAYTIANNNSDQILGTSLINGENLVVEYYEPAAVSGQGQLNIGTVIHGYKSLSLYAQGLLKGLNDSGNCNNDVKCPLGVGWESQINSVAIIIVGGSGACTGALVNNTSQDGTPYFLSANHCGTTGLGNWVFRFNWDSPVARCAVNQNSTDPGAPYNQVNGATLRANRSQSDFCLMQLNSTPTGNIYYAGWNRGTTPATQATCVHHPSGDVKKISRENNAVTTSTFSGAQTWQVANWDSGTTEPGSSGSPLFDQDKRIIGQLYGGGAACSGLVNNGQPDYYGRFDISWTGGGANNNRLSNWLDPSGSGVTVLDGYDPNASNLAVDAGLSQVSNPTGTYCNQSSFTPEITLRNFGTSPLTSATITYSLNGAASTNFNWTGNLASGATTTVTMPSINVTTSGANTYNATVTSANGQSDGNALNNVATSNFNVVLGGQQAGLTLRTDCWGSETSWQILSGSTVLYTSPSYSDGAPTIYTSSLCLGVGCYTFSIADSYGDGINGAAYSQCGQDGYYYIIDPNGDTLVTMGVADFGNGTTHNFCITAPSSVDPAISKLTDLNIYPNPNQGQFTLDLKLNNSAGLEIQIINSLGQILKTSNYNAAAEYQVNLNLQDEAAGMYFVKLNFANETVIRKVVKQ